MLFRIAHSLNSISCLLQEFSCVTLGLLFAAVTKTVESTVVDRKGRGRESSDHACASITLLTVELLAQP